LDFGLLRFDAGFCRGQFGHCPGQRQDMCGVYQADDGQYCCDGEQALRLVVFAPGHQRSLLVSHRDQYRDSPLTKKRPKPLISCTFLLSLLFIVVMPGNTPVTGCSLYILTADFVKHRLHIRLILVVVKPFLRL
jgi:hypothetical protein